MNQNINEIIEEIIWNETQALVAQIRQERENAGLLQFDIKQVRASIDHLSIVLKQDNVLLTPKE